MTAQETRLFFAESIDPSAFVNHCTRVLFARLTDRERLHLRWKADDGMVWALGVRQTLAGQFSAPAGVSEGLGGPPASGVGFAVDEQPSSQVIGFLVVTALLWRWRGCVIAAGDPTIITPKDMQNPTSLERLLQDLCERGSHEE